MSAAPARLRAFLLLCTSGVVLAAALGAETPRPPESAAQQPAGSGFILGRVVDGATGQPIAEAVVSTNLRPQAPTPVMPPGARQGGPPQLRVLTGLDGRFLFRDLPAGSYMLTAAAAGYLNGASGQTRPAGTSRPVVLEPDQRVVDAVVRLWRAAAVSGTVLDDRDEPVSGVWVRPLRVGWQAGRRQFLNAGQSRTDERGRFRVASLSPGAYVLGVPIGYSTAPATLVTGIFESIATGRDLGTILTLGRSGVSMPNPDSARIGSFLVGVTGGMADSIVLPPPGQDGVLDVLTSTYLPGGSSPTDVGALVLASGDERTDVVIRLARVRAGRVDGRVTDAEGRPMAGVGVQLVVEDVPQAGPFGSPASAVTADDGSFSMLAVAPGGFRARAERRGMPAPPPGQALNPMAQMMMAGAPPESLVAESPVTVGAGGTTAVHLTIRPGARIRGRARFEGASAPPDGTRLQSFTVTAAGVGPVATLPAPPSRGNASRPGQLQPDGTFETQPLGPGRYLIAVNPPAPWRLESALVGAKDATVEPIDISGVDVADVVVTFTDVVASVSGQVRGRDGEVSREAIVFAFPADYRRWIERGMTGNADARAAAPAGSFNFQRLRPGEYLVAAVLDADLADRNDPGFIERVASLATPVSLPPGSPQTVDLIAIRVTR